MAGSNGNLYKRADGFCENGSGNIAIFMLRGRKEATDSDVYAFSYRPSYLADIITLRWGGNEQYFAPEIANFMNNIGLFTTAIAEFCVKNNYARNLTAGEVALYNKALNEDDQDPAVPDSETVEAEEVEEAKAGSEGDSAAEEPDDTLAPESDDEVEEVDWGNAGGDEAEEAEEAESAPADQKLKRGRKAAK